MAKFMLDLMLIGSMLAGGCAEDSEPTYYIDFEADEEPQSLIAESFQQWRMATGSAPQESNTPQGARVVLNEGQLPPEFYDQTIYTTEKLYHQSSLETVDTLSMATITIRPDVWNLDSDTVVKFFNHEIGHIMTGAPHTSQCPSTMHTDFILCGQITIDPQASAQAIERINNGWWQKRASPLL